MDLISSFVDTVQFIFTPSLNIGVYQLAHYQCSVDHPNSIIVLLVNGTVSTNIEIEQLGITTSGAGTRNSSLTIPGYPQYNNTIIKCIITFALEGDPKNATLRIQGIISMVITTSLFLLTYLALSLSVR